MSVLTSEPIGKAGTSSACLGHGFELTLPDEFRVQKRRGADQEKSLGTDCRRHCDRLKESRLVRRMRALRARRVPVRPSEQESTVVVVPRDANN